MSDASWSSRLLAAVVVCLAVAATGLALGWWSLRVAAVAGDSTVESWASYQSEAGQTVRLRDRFGAVWSELDGPRRTVVELADVPAHFLGALLASEDQGFYDHDGVDGVAVVRALVKNVEAGAFVEGGSTLTQQLARTLALNSDKTLGRKLDEAVVARRLELDLDKRTILAMYVNEVYFGEGCYGVDEAARRYFGKRARALDIAESAALVASLPAPSLLNPRVAPSENKARRARVLRRMVSEGWLATGAAKAAENRELVLSPADSRARKRHPWARDAVRRALRRQGAKLQAGAEVYTTIDLRAQRIAEDVVADAKVPPGAEVALVVLDRLTSEVRAVVGGKDYTRSPYPRALMARRQMGSTFKPFVVAAGIEALGWSERTTFSNARLSLGRGRSRWRPRNATGRYSSEPVALGDALAKSLNVVAVRAAREVGVPAIVDLARRAGFRSPMPPDLTIALGSGSATPLELATAYGTLARQGVARVPRWITRVEGLDGSPLATPAAADGRQAIPQATARSVASMLERVVATGTGRAARRGVSADVVVAGKTGTTERAVDAWFAGFTDRYVCVVWVGRDDAKPMKRASGGRIAAPIFASTVAKLHALEAVSERSLSPLPSVAGAR